MNSKQRRARVRAALPGAFHRLGVLRLMDEIESKLADSFAATLRDPHLKLHSLEGVVRSIHQIERSAELRRAYAGYITPGRTVTGRIMGAHPSLGARYSGKSAHTVFFDESSIFK